MKRRLPESDVIHYAKAISDVSEELPDGCGVIQIKLVHGRIREIASFERKGKIEPSQR